MLHLRHNLLQLLLDDMLFLAERDVFGDGLSACVCVSILNPQNPLVTQLSRGEATTMLLHVRHDYALTAKGLAHVSVEELIAFPVRWALAEG